MAGDQTVVGQNVRLLSSSNSVSLGNSVTITITDSINAGPPYVIQEDNKILLRTNNTSFRYTPTKVGTHTLIAEQSNGNSQSGCTITATSGDRKQAIAKRFIDIIPYFINQFKVDSFYNINNWQAATETVPQYAIDGQGIYVDNNNTVRMQARCWAHLKRDIIHSTNYKLEFDMYRSTNSRGGLYFFVKGTIDPSEHTGFELVRDVGDTGFNRFYMDGTSDNITNYSSDYIGFTGTKHIIITRNNNIGSIQIGDNKIENIDVNGLGNQVGAFKWGSGYVSLSNFELTKYGNKTDVQISNVSNVGGVYIQGRLTDLNNNSIINEPIILYFTNTSDANFNEYRTVMTNTSGYFSYNTFQITNNPSNLECTIIHKENYTYKKCISGPHEIEGNGSGSGGVIIK